MLSMKRQNMKGKRLTDSDSENKDAEKVNEIEEQNQEFLGSPAGRAIPDNPALQSIVGLSVTGGHSGPPWSNPEILKDLSPEMRNELLRVGLDASGKRDENRFQYIQQKLTAETESHKRNQWFGLAVIVIVLLTCFALSWLFLTFGAKELVAPVITGLGGLGAGFAGGYGFGRKSGRGS